MDPGEHKKICGKAMCLATGGDKAAVTAEVAAEALQRVGGSTLDVQALDLEFPSSVVIRVGGVAAGLQGRIERVHGFLQREGDVDLDDQPYWARVREFRWVSAGSALVKAVLIPGMIPELERSLADFPIARRYGVGGNVAWLSLSDEGIFGILNGVLKKHRLRGLRLFSCGNPPAKRDDTPLFCGVGAADQVFAERVRSAFDPHHRFPELA